MPIPLILIGDAPTQPSGLGRVSRDLGTLIWDNVPEVQLLQIGLQSPQGSMAWQGPWPLVTFSGYERMGAATLDRVLSQFRGPTGVVFALWDAHFSFDLLKVAREYDWQFWIYPPVDAVNQDGVFGGPAAEVIRQADRVLAYGQWAAGVLTKIRQQPVEGIPLGISEIWQPAAIPATEQIIGCVATNQPRKDLNLYFATIAELRRRGHQCSAWLLTDAQIKKSGSSWSIPELRLIHGLDEGIQIFEHKDHIGDAELVRLYQQSSVTIAPGCGEGFGYPIVESMACGVPVVHHDYAGGAELGGYNLSPTTWRVDGVYALQRPILKPTNVADAVELAFVSPHRALFIQQAEKYRWPTVWPQWETWIRAGIAIDAAAGVI